MSLEDVIVHIKIEEQNRLKDMARNLHSNADVIETKPQFDKRQNNPNKKLFNNKGKNPIAKKKGHYYVCGKIGDYAY